MRIELIQMIYKLDGFFFLVNKHRRKHDLAEAFDAPRKAIIASRFVFPIDANVVNWNASDDYQNADQQVFWLLQARQQHQNHA